MHSHVIEAQILQQGCFVCQKITVSVANTTRTVLWQILGAVQYLARHYPQAGCLAIFHVILSTKVLVLSSILLVDQNATASSTQG